MLDNDNKEKNTNGEQLIYVKEPLPHRMFNWFETFCLALAIVVLMYTFGVRGMRVKGDSMRETLHDQDVITLSALFYTPKQGDIVIIQTFNLDEEKSIIKRVIATEGQTVDINFDTWEVSVDGVVLDEPYVNYIEGQSMNIGSMGADAYPLTVEKGKVFVMGDNRNNSLDSRYSVIGQVDVNNIIGRLLVRVLPVNKIGRVNPNVQ